MAPRYVRTLAIPTCIYGPITGSAMQSHHHRQSHHPSRANPIELCFKFQSEPFLLPTLLPHFIVLPGKQQGLGVGDSPLQDEDEQQCTSMWQDVHVCSEIGNFIWIIKILHALRGNCLFIQWSVVVVEMDAHVYWYSLLPPCRLCWHCAFPLLHS